MQGLRYNAKWKKGLVLGAVSLVAILAMRWAAGAFMGSQASLMFFTVPVLIAAYFGGLGPGLAVTAASCAIGVALFVVPNHAPGASWRIDYLRTSVFLGQGILVSVLTEELHRSRSRAERAAEGLRASDEQVRALLGAAEREVSERRGIEAAMGDHLARTRAILDGAADAIITFDTGGRIESANPSAERFFGYTADELAGRDVRELLAIDKGNEELSAEAVRARLTCGRETVGRRCDGSTFPAEVSVRDMELAGRKLCACFVKDVTRRKAAEEQYRQLNERLEQRVAERTRQLEEVNEELNAFTYTVSHDLRSPLRGIQRFAQVVLSDDPEVTAEMREEAARRTLASGARMERLIQDLLEYSRLTREEFRPQRVSLILVVQEVLGQLKRDPQYARSHVVVREPLPVVLGHRAVLARVFMNLLENAMKYVSAGTEPCVRVWADEKCGVVRVWVEDNGVGIAEKDREGIFEPFGQAAAGDAGVSAGLGLAIVRKGVERMGGRLGLESEVGRGSRFWVELPAG